MNINNDTDDVAKTSAPTTEGQVPNSPVGVAATPPDDSIVNEIPPSIELAQKVWEIEKKISRINSSLATKWYADKRFWAGVCSLPFLIITGWIFHFLDSKIKNEHLDTMPFLHSMLGTKEAIKGYINPDQNNRKDNIRDEIINLFNAEYITKNELNNRQYISTTELNGRNFITENFINDQQYLTQDSMNQGSTQSFSPNFNDIFISSLGLSDLGSLNEVNCEQLPRNADILDINGPTGDACFEVGDKFRTDASFTILKPHDVEEIVFEIFLVPLVQKLENEGPLSEELSLNNIEKNKIFRLHVNALELAVSNPVGTEMEFIEKMTAFKYEITFEVPDQESDRTYDILTVSLSLNEYDTIFGERKDKTFAIFVVPSFVKV